MKQAVSLVILASLAISGCEYRKLEDLRTAEPTGTPFQKALWHNYRVLSLDEERVYDWEHAVMYATKALDSAYGQAVLPETVENWDIPEDLRPQFVKAREDLLAALATDAKDVRPQLLADAQTHFDCWLEQQQEGWQTEDIALCREGFYDALQELTAPPEEELAAVPVDKKPVSAKKPAAPLPKKIAAPKPAEKPPEALAAPKPPKAKETETASYIVFFQADDVALDTAAMGIVSAAAESLGAHESYRVIINANTDNSASAKLDPELPTKRAESIKARLIEAGISPAAIDITAKSEADSAAKAPVSRTPVARQVEIFITE